VSLRREIEDALAEARTARAETIAIRSKDEVFRNACAAAAAVAGDADWSAPIARKATAEIGAFVRDLLRAPRDAPVTLTGGGTESNFLALKTARERAGAKPGKRLAPNVVMPRSAHPCLSKAAQHLGIAEIRVPLGADHRADPEALASAITEETIMVVASLPSDSHGVCDEVPAIARLAERHGIWCHVDACLGGFLVPFLKQLGYPLPDFDFAVPGVRSISLDQHKYGYAPTGLSTLVLRDAEDLLHQRFAFSDWDGPAKTYDYFDGTRSIEAVVAGWATMRQLGADGYLRAAARVQIATRELYEAVGGLPGVVLLNRPEAGAVHFAVDGVDPAKVGSGLAALGHARFNLTTDPAGVIVFVGRHCDAEVIRTYVSDLATLLPRR
jgi:glutamate/tyrosine decarboxylase-like PLP-dependent enzyme